MFPAQPPQRSGAGGRVFVVGLLATAQPALALTSSGENLLVTTASRQLRGSRVYGSGTNTWTTINNETSQTGGSHWIVGHAPSTFVIKWVLC